MKDAVSARPRPRNAGSSSTIRRCCDGQKISRRNGQATSAASKNDNETGRIRRLVKIAMSIVAEPFRRVSADQAAEIWRANTFPTRPETPSTRKADETSFGLAL